MKSESEVAQSRPTLSDPMDCNPPGSSVHGIFQARVLEWVAIACSRRSLTMLNNYKLILFSLVELFLWFLNFLSALIKLILWLKFFHRQKAD